MRMLIVISLLLSLKDARASAVNMGNIESIYPDSFSSGLRSPALVPAQEKNIEMGLIFKYKALYKSKGDFNAGISFLDNPNLKSENTDSFGATAYYSFCVKSGDTGFGIGIMASDDDQLMRSTDKTELSGYFTGSPIFVQSITEEKKSSTNPALSFSLGTKAGENSYTGLKLSGGYSKTVSKSDERFYQDSVIASLTKSTVTSELYSAELQFGFFTRENDSQAGIIIKSPTVSQKKTKIEYENPMSGISPGTENISGYTQIKKGPSLVAGGYTKFFNFLGLALEGEYRFPAYYNEKNFEKASDNRFYEEKMKMMPLPEYQARGGIELTLSPAVQLTLGGGFMYSGSYGIDKQPDGSTRKEQNFEYRVFFGEMGLDFSLTGGTKLVLGGIYSRLNVKADMNSDMHMKVKQDLTILNTFLGFSLAF